MDISTQASISDDDRNTALEQVIHLCAQGGISPELASLMAESVGRLDAFERWSEARTRKWRFKAIRGEWETLGLCEDFPELIYVAKDSVLGIGNSTERAFTGIATLVERKVMDMIVKGTPLP